ncbi:hypothetical protein FSP39_019501 [Pinctada imbricata]|uniref:Translocation protein SEC62 n=1 Tax=Pinctada imbricata TaxID=66713 RepID=A0AA88YTS6_PINIB|nr:hypothetical protein FSP39_019501 [Pinctada imbricata]
MTTRRIGFKRVRRVRVLKKLAPKYEFCVSPFDIDDDGDTDDDTVMKDEIGEEEGRCRCHDNVENDDEDNEEDFESSQQDGDFVTSIEDLENKARLADEKEREKAEKAKLREIRQNNPPKQNKGRKNFLDWKAKVKDNEKATKEEYAIAKHVRFNCPTMDAKFVPMQNMVKCFYGNKAIDCLLDSKWAKGGSGDINLTDRKSCAQYMEKLMMKGLLHRATKIAKTKKDRDKKRKKKEEDSALEEEKKDKKDKKKVKEKDGKESKDSEGKDEDTEVDKEEKKGEDKEKKKKEKKEKKFRLDMAEEQRFIDGEEIYVWIYDPVPLKTFVIGLLMVIGAIALCLFPLWPDWMRVAVYYISLVGASFVGLILVLVIIRGILFCAIWLVTFGKLHFWLLPNLTEDVGFFDSFKPGYTYKLYRAEDIEKEKEEEEKRKKKREEKRKKKEEEKYDQEKEEGFEVVEKSEVEGSQEELEEGSQGSQGEGDENEEQTGEDEEEAETEEGSEEQGEEDQEGGGDYEGETKKTK